MIQQNINQAISLAGFLFTQTPTYETMSKNVQLQKELKKGIKTGEAIAKEKGLSPEVLEQGKAVRDIREQIAKNKPTAENWQKVSESESAVKGYEEELYQAAQEEAEEEFRMGEIEAWREQEMYNQADSSLRAKQENKRESEKRKKGYISPSVRFSSEMGRKEKHKLTTAIEQENKRMKKEEQRNG